MERGEKDENGKEGKDMFVELEGGKKQGKRENMEMRKGEKVLYLCNARGKERGKGDAVEGEMGKGEKYCVFGMGEERIWNKRTNGVSWSAREKEKQKKE